MKRICICFIAVLFLMTSTIPVFVNGQVSGIKFESGISWNDILLKAKAEKKFIFVDCFSTWCGPCKWMSKNIFPQKEVGDFFNEHFINVAIQMDRTAKDSDEVKARYNDAAKIAKYYNINSYPTYLFFSPDGEAVHYVVGSIKTSKEFISAAEDALNPGRQYFAMIKQLQEHRTDSVFLLKVFEHALRIQDKENAIRIEPLYLESIVNPFTRENIKSMTGFIRLSDTSGTKSFDFFKSNAQVINEIVGDSNFVHREMGVRIIPEEEIGSYFERKLFPIDWSDIASKIRLAYPLLGESLIKIVGWQFGNYCRVEIRKIAVYKKGSKDRWSQIEKQIKQEIVEFDLRQILLDERARYYAKRKLWSKCARASFLLMRKFGDALGESQMNSISWDYIFKHCDNRRIVAEAIKWMRHYLDRNPKLEENADTYANLLYKSGRRYEAMQWEQRAIQLAEKGNLYPGDVAEYKSNLKKMESGIPTWQNLPADSTAN